jgi:hypothetical protein
MQRAASRTSSTNERNYILKIEVNEVEDLKIIRTLSVPPSTTFHELHYAIQIAFGWENAHLYQFEVIDKPPPSQRRFVPRRSLMRILSLLQTDDFDFGDGTIMRRTVTTPVSLVFGAEQYRRKYIEYWYDFGDDWEHSATLIGHAEQHLSSNVITCLSGEGGSIVEDCPCESPKFGLTDL